MDFQWLLEPCWQKAFIFPSPARPFLVVFQQKDKAPFTGCCKVLIPHLTQVALFQIRPWIAQSNGALDEKRPLVNEHGNQIKKAGKALESVKRLPFK